MLIKPREETRSPPDILCRNTIVPGTNKTHYDASWTPICWVNTLCRRKRHPVNHNGNPVHIRIALEERLTLMHCIFFVQLTHSGRPRQNGRYFPDDILKCIFLNENVWISIRISQKFVPSGPINDIPALVQIMAYGFVASCGVVAATTFFRYSKFTHVRETKVLSFGGVLRWFHWMMSFDNLQCVRWRESRRDDDIFVLVNNHWVFFFMKSHIYWYLKLYPFLWSYCDKIVFSYFMCTLSQTLFLSTSLLFGSFRYVFNIIIVLTCVVSICRF